MSNEPSPEKKRSLEISSELYSLHKRIVELQREQWALEGYPPIPVVVTYDDGETNISEPFHYTKDHDLGVKFLSPEIEGRFKFKTVLKAKNV